MLTAMQAGVSFEFKSSDQDNKTTMSLSGLILGLSLWITKGQRQYLMVMISWCSIREKLVHIAPLDQSYNKVHEVCTIETFCWCLWITLCDVALGVFICNMGVCPRKIWEKQGLQWWLLVNSISLISHNLIFFYFADFGTNTYWRRKIQKFLAYAATQGPATKQRFLGIFHHI